MLKDKILEKFIKVILRFYDTYTIQGWDSIE